ncbi:hypothetical protein [Thalassomonas haliotis]|uniref:Uncharacterized protein n=1 Tax=Thalassomonas haliotis TaxID=485448 RepID=A0ABY7V943_9GAMM|nr:hypothetical protein [Thalassomonas haliotis]WDE10093.1 hypothetical protein H3N35_17585 [Thalassomonas haliotis]
MIKANIFFWHKACINPGGVTRYKVVTMPFSVNNKQSILNTCMIRSLIEVFFFSAGFLALSYFVIKHLQYDQGGSDKLTGPLSISLDVNNLQAQKTRTWQMALGHQLPGERGQVSGALNIFSPNFTWAQTDLHRYRENKACRAKVADYRCLVENNLSALIAGYLWEDKHREVNFGLNRESL